MKGNKDFSNKKTFSSNKDTIYKGQGQSEQLLWLFLETKWGSVSRPHTTTEIENGIQFLIEFLCFSANFYRWVFSQEKKERKLNWVKWVDWMDHPENHEKDQFLKTPISL